MFLIGSKSLTRVPSFSSPFQTSRSSFKHVYNHPTFKRFVNFYTGYTNKALKRRATCAELMCENHFAQKVIQSPERPKVWPECCGFGIDWVSNSKVAVGRELFFLNTTTQELKGNAALI